MNKAHIVYNTTPSGVDVLYSGLSSADADSAFKKAVQESKKGGHYVWFGKNRIIRQKKHPLKVSPKKSSKEKVSKDADDSNN